MSHKPVDGIYTCPQCGSMYSRYGEWVFRHVKDASLCQECKSVLKESEDPFQDILRNPFRPDALEGISFCLEQIKKYGLAEGISWHSKVTGKLTVFEMVNILVEAEKEIKAFQL